MSEKDWHELCEAITSQNVGMFGCSLKDVPLLVGNKKVGRARFFSHGLQVVEKRSDALRIFNYDALSTVRDDRSDVYFLDTRAAKVFFVDFPGTARYVLLRATPRFSWLIAIPGLLRRLKIGLVTYQGVCTLETEKGSARWFVFRHELQQVLNARLSIAEEIGTEGLFDYLKKEGVNYVVMRFFQKLPALYREGGDLDLLVSDEDERKVKTYLNEHPGPIGVDVWTPSRATHNSITYYPPPLARAIIASAQTGPVGSRVPSPREAFLGFAYHVLYHKGLFAGVPSINPGLKVNNNPENDYLGELERLAHAAGVEAELTLEGLDEYLSQVGWRPKPDTLAKIAVHNRWVWQHFFKESFLEEKGLSVFIVRQYAVDADLLPRIVEILEENNFSVLQVRHFDEQTRAQVRDHIRGGVWNDVSGARPEYLPAAAIVAIDTLAARESHGSSLVAQRTKKVKSMLRTTLDDGRKVSAVHSSDNTEEAWEYVRWCFPDSEASVRDMVEKKMHALRPGFFERVQIRVRKVPHKLLYHILKLKDRAGHALIRALMR